MPGKHQHIEGGIDARLPRTRREVVSWDCKDGVHAGCDICDCDCHLPPEVEL